MASKTTTAAVKGIIVTSMTDPEIEVFITTAHTFLENLTWKSTLPEAVQLEVETWLTAHFMSVSKVRTTIKEKVGEVQVDFVNAFGQGLNASQYGQMALVLDTSGTLADIAAGKKLASMQAIKQFE